MSKQSDALREYFKSHGIRQREVCEVLGLTPATMYWARHTFASLMLETGAPVEVIAEALGHSYGPKVTMGYVTIRERAVDEAVRKVYDLLAEPSK